MTVLIQTALLLRRLAALPGRLLIRWVDRRKASNGVGPLNAFQRGCVHAFLWFWVMVAVLMTTNSPPTATAAPRPPVVRPTVAPTTTWTPPTSGPTSAPPVEDPDPVYVPLPDDDDDGESWFCRRRRWC